jgi:beta-glucosidase
LNAGSIITQPNSSESGNGRPDSEFSVLPAAEGRSRPIEFVGSATSDFQADPLQYDDAGRPCICTDWEYELTRLMAGKQCGIPDADATALPQFLRHTEAYTTRSAELSENMLRLSLDFGRLSPAEGQFNEPLMKEYVKACALARMRELEPFVTLHHFTLPKCLLAIDRAGMIKAGGWEHRDAVQHFRFYTQNVVRYLADPDRVRGALTELGMSSDAQQKILAEGLVNYFMTINEPTVLLFNSYVGGMFPPYRRGNLLMVRRLLHRLVQVHDIAIDEIKQGLKAQRCEPQVGVGHNWQYFDTLLGKLGRWFQEYFVTTLERQGKHSDFLGVHYYFRWNGPRSRGRKRRLEYSDHPSFGDVYPAGIRNVIAQVNSLCPQKPIIISEFGFSDTTDLRRPYWILETVRHILDARREGMPIKGILLWTLVSNFEWQLGMSQKFGLFSEAELREPRMPSTQGIRSWEAWRAACRAILSPTIDNQRELQRCHQVAYAQYQESGGRY